MGTLAATVRFHEALTSARLDSGKAGQAISSGVQPAGPDG